MSTDPRVARAIELYRRVFLELDEMACATAGSIAAEAAFKAHLESMAAEIARLTAELEEARKDAGRLDWINRQYLEDLGLGLVVDAPHDGEYYVNGNDCTTYYGKTLRDAIDAAMTKEKP